MNIFSLLEGRKLRWECGRRSIHPNRPIRRTGVSPVYVIPAKAGIQNISTYMYELISANRAIILSANL